LADQKSLIIKLAHIYYHTGSWDKAIVEYQKIIALDPHDFNVRVTVGELYLKKGDLERAYREFEAAGNGFLNEKNHKKALAAFRELAHLIQKIVEPQDIEKATLLYKDILMKLPEALESLVNLRDLYQRHNQRELAVSCSIRLGDIYNQQDYMDKAEIEYKNALGLDSENAEAKAKLEKLKSESPTPL
jgi:tetratricopeptide (TPR) repeat protein